MISVDITAALKYEQIKNHPERISKTEPFIEQYDTKGTNFPSYKKDQKKFEINNEPVALNILYVLYKTEKIRRGYNSRHNKDYQNQVSFSMISDGKNWIYLPSKFCLHYLEGYHQNMLKTFIA